MSDKTPPLSFSTPPADDWKPFNVEKVRVTDSEWKPGGIGTQKQVRVLSTTDDKLVQVVTRNLFQRMLTSVSAKVTEQLGLRSRSFETVTYQREIGPGDKDIISDDNKIITKDGKIDSNVVTRLIDEEYSKKGEFDRLSKQLNKQLLQTYNDHWFKLIRLQKEGKSVEGMIKKLEDWHDNIRQLHTRIQKGDLRDLEGLKKDLSNANKALNVLINKDNSKLKEKPLKGKDLSESPRRLKEEGEGVDEPLKRKQKAGTGQPVTPSQVPRTTSATTPASSPVTSPTFTSSPTAAPRRKPKRTPPEKPVPHPPNQPAVPPMGPNPPTGATPTPTPDQVHPTT